MDSPPTEVPPIHVTTFNSSLPSLISVSTCELNLSSVLERKDQEENKTFYERLALDLEKGEVEMKKELVTPIELDQTLKSTDRLIVRNDEIIFKEQRDLSASMFTFAGAQSIPVQALMLRLF